MSGELVLISGATGFVGSAVTKTFLDAGHRVRGTTRSEQKAQEFSAKHSKYAAQLEWAIVKDIAAEGAFDEAVKGATIVVHTASPLIFDPKDNVKEILTPAIQGTINMLKASKKVPSVKRVVLTSSMSSILDFSKLGPDAVYNSDSWNPWTYETAVVLEGPLCYVASKKLAEEAAWDFMKKEQPSFDLSVNNAGFIFGSPDAEVLSSHANLSITIASLWALVDATEVPLAPFPVWVDIHDIAKIHLLQAFTPAAGGQRYTTVQGKYNYGQIIDIIKKHFPEQAHRLPSTEGFIPVEHYSVDCSKVEKDLGITWTSLEDSIVATMKELFALEEKVKAAK